MLFIAVCIGMFMEEGMWYSPFSQEKNVDDPETIYRPQVAILTQVVLVDYRNEYLLWFPYKKRVLASTMCFIRDVILTQWKIHKHNKHM